MEKGFFLKHRNGRNHPQMLALRGKLGLTGYGLFFEIAEVLCENGGSYNKDYTSLAKELCVSPEELKSVVEEFGLFEVSDTEIKAKDIDNLIKY